MVFVSLKHTKKIKDLIQTLDKSNVNVLVVSSEQGWGKTSSVLSCMKELGYAERKDWVLLNGHLTPLALYCALYDNSDKKFVILDDVSNLLRPSNTTGLGLLKGATSSLSADEDRRKVCYNSTSKLLEGYPNTFFMLANVIILLNSLSRNHAEVKPVLDRGFFYDIKLSWFDKVEILRQVVNKNISLRRGFDWLVNNCEGQDNVSIRSLFKLAELIKYNPDDWEGLASALFCLHDKKSVYDDSLMKDMSVFYELESLDISVNKRVKLFKKFSGKSRSFYFFLKKKVQSPESN